MALAVKFIAFAAGVLLAGCVARIDVLVFNNTFDPIAFRYGSVSVLIEPRSVERIKVDLTDQTIIVTRGDGEALYDFRLQRLPGRCYVPGLRHSVKLQLDQDGTFHILARDQEFPTRAGACGQYSAHET